MKMIKNRIDNDNWLVYAAPLGTESPPPDAVWMEVEPCTLIQLALYPSNPYWGDRLRDINKQVWFYKQDFHLPKTLPKRIRLQFDGVDYFASVYVNGQHVGDHEGAFVPFTFDVTDVVKAGENTVIIHVSSPWDKPNPGGTYPTDHVVRGLVKGLYEHGEGVIPPNVNPLGIFQPVWVLMDDGLSIDNVDIRTKINGDVNLCLHVSNTLSSTWEGTLKATITAENHMGDGASILSPITVEIGQHTSDHMMTVPNPYLWWPWDHGEPNLYCVEIMLQDSDETVVATYSSVFGIREVELQRSRKQFTYLINNRPVAIRGTSYMPSVYLSLATENRLQWDVDLAKKANLNLLRVHVHVSPPELYTICDRMGMLIIQDFELNWVHDPSPEFEARALKLQTDMIKKLYNHPSVITWMCHNEPTMIFTQRHNLEKHPDPALYEAAVQQDPTRPVFISSGQSDSDWRRSGDSHTYYGALWTKNYTDIHKHNHYKFHTEFGFEAPAAPQTLRLYDDTWERLGHLAPQVEELWQYQAELTRYHVEYLRVLRAKGCAGYVHFWLTDIVPQVGCGVLDAKRIPKGGYEALRKASQPLHVVMEYDSKRPIAMWVLNDTMQSYSNAVYTWIAYDREKQQMARGDIKLTVAANAAQLVTDVQWEGLNCSRVELTLKSSTGKRLAENRYQWPFYPMKRPKGYPWKFDSYLGCKVFDKARAESLANVSNNAIVHIVPTRLREPIGEWVLRQRLPTWMVRGIATVVDWMG